MRPSCATWCSEPAFCRTSSHGSVYGFVKTKKSSCSASTPPQPTTRRKEFGSPAYKTTSKSITLKTKVIGCTIIHLNMDLSRFSRALYGSCPGYSGHDTEMMSPAVAVPLVVHSSSSPQQHGSTVRCGSSEPALRIVFLRSYTHGDDVAR